MLSWMNMTRSLSFSSESTTDACEMLDGRFFGQGLYDQRKPQMFLKRTFVSMPDHGEFRHRNPMIRH